VTGAFALKVKELLNDALSQCEDWMTALLSAHSIQQHNDHLHNKWIYMESASGALPTA